MWRFTIKDDYEEDENEPGRYSKLLKCPQSINDGDENDEGPGKRGPKSAEKMSISFDKYYSGQLNRLRMTKYCITNNNEEDCSEEAPLSSLTIFSSSKTRKADTIVKTPIGEVVLNNLPKFWLTVLIRAKKLKRSSFGQHLYVNTNTGLQGLFSSVK